MSSGWHYTTRGLAYRNMTTNEGGLVSPYANLPRGVMPFWTHAHALSLYYRQVKRGLVVEVILSPEEYNSTHSICTTYLQLFHKCMPLAVAREAEAHRADNRELTVMQREGSRVLGGIFYCSQMCRAHCILKKSGSVSVGLTFTYSLMIQHGADKYDIMAIAKHAYTMWDITSCITFR